MPNPSNIPFPDLEARLWRDPWLMASALQKAIRHGEIDVAERSALALSELRGVNVWRRLIVTAFEDVGIGSTDALIELVETGSAAIRAKRPTGSMTLLGAVRALAEAPKDRSTDYLMSIVSLSPELEPVRERLGSMTTAERLAIVGEDANSIEQRAAAAWYCSGLDVGDEKRLGRGDRPALMRLFRDLGVPDPLVDASDIAATMTREPICMFLPLLWLISRNGPRSIEYPSVRSGPRVGGLPLVTLGMHTRSGRTAIAAFTRTAPIRKVLERWVPVYRVRDVAFNAEFHVAGGTITPRLHWSEGHRIERLAVDADLVHAGADPNSVEPILMAFRQNLDLLDDIRGRLLVEAFGMGADQ